MVSPITLQMLRIEYGMTEYVFNNMIQPIRDELFSLRGNGETKKSKKKYRLRTLSPKQVKRLREHLGNPDEYKKQ